MAGRFTMAVEIDRLHLDRLRRKLTGTTLLGPDLRDVMDQTMAEVEVKAHARAPYGQTLQLSSSIQRSIDHGAVPAWAKVSANAVNGSFRYGWALQNSRAVIFRYQRGPRALRKTYHWFSGAMGGARKRLDRRLDALRLRIEGRWRG